MNNPVKHDPFISYYTKNNVSPVRQDISSLLRHYARRDYLYRYLGIAPNSFSGKKVIEFGPGSGHNALYVTSLDPAEYMLVDANPKGLEESKSLLKSHFPSYVHEFVQSRIQDFETEKAFDIVLCEGVIPHQDDPISFSRHIGKFLKPGGILVITTADYVGFPAEVIRRLIRDTLIDSDAPMKEQLGVLCPLFESHYATLRGASRPLEDWVVDNIIHPWVNPLFSIRAAIEGLDPDYEILGSSPRFLTDWRWYKDLGISSANLNSMAIDQYQKNGLSFLDYRTEAIQISDNVYTVIEKMSEDLYWTMVEIETKKVDKFKECGGICAELSKLLKTASPITAESFEEASTYLNFSKTIDPNAHFSTFKSFFGRAQQYISLVKRPSYLD